MHFCPHKKAFSPTIGAPSTSLASVPTLPGGCLRREMLSYCFRLEYTRKDSPEHTQKGAALTLSAACELYAHTLVHVLAQIQHSALLVPRLTHPHISHPSRRSSIQAARALPGVHTQWWSSVLWTLCLCLMPINIYKVKKDRAGEGFPANDHQYHICAAPQTSSEQRGCC